MDDPQTYLRHLERLKAHRTSRDSAEPIGFLRKTFNRDVQRPFKQLEKITPVWLALVPAHLAKRCVLEGLSRGVLKVAVDDSATLYEIDRLLRSGGEQRLAGACPGANLRRVRIRVAPSGQGE